MVSGTSARVLVFFSLLFSIFVHARCLAGVVLLSGPTGRCSGEGQACGVSIRSWPPWQSSPPPKEDSNVMKPPYKSQLFNSAVASPFLNYHENTKDLKQ